MDGGAEWLALKFSRTQPLFPFVAHCTKIFGFPIFGASEIWHQSCFGEVSYDDQLHTKIELEHRQIS